MYEVLGTFTEKGPTLGLEVPLAILIQTPPHLVLVCSAPNHLNPTVLPKANLTKSRNLEILRTVQ